MKKRLYIHGFASVSALGTSAEEVWEAYLHPFTCFSLKKLKDKNFWVSSLSDSAKAQVKRIRQENKSYANLDETVLYAILATRCMLKKYGITTSHLSHDTGINIGSSRGATQLFETNYADFQATGMVSSLTSPTTTLGNVSSWVAQDVGSQGAVISHSITCSTALHGILNAAAWLRSGMASQFIVGGTEAPLTAFTIAQLQALKLYSTLKESYPCRSLDLSKGSNSLVLGEAAGVFALSLEASSALVEISGIGYANEKIEHSIAISSDALCFQNSMKMALADAQLTAVDAVILHAPGTVKGDLAEVKAIENVFATPPFLTTNKWKIGHTYGASGAMSLEMAILMLLHQECLPNPFYSNLVTPSQLRHIMVNAVGFGGNAVSLIISKL